MRRKLLLIRRVVGSSMEPTFAEGQVLIASPLARVRLHDVVLLRHNGLEKLKRVAKLEGGMVFLAGDNPAASTDSRHFGRLSKDVITGTVIWPRRHTLGSAYVAASER